MAREMIDTKQAQALFGVTAMTLWLWRSGTPTKEPMPYEKKGRSISYSLSKLKAWAKVHGVTMNLADSKNVHQAKPGPKVGTTHVKLAKKAPEKKSSKRASVTKRKH
jgi:hypothetical protein